MFVRPGRFASEQNGLKWADAYGFDGDAKRESYFDVRAGVLHSPTGALVRLEARRRR